FGKADPASGYGAAGSIVLLMLWVNYSGMIMFLGAEFTKQYAVHFGHEIVPKGDAKIVEGGERVREAKNKQTAVNKMKKHKTYSPHPDKPWLNIKYKTNE
ncbi:MAG: YihY/virulence factor BrkB family protein, partial [Bacteroidota bacterium]|nr:YihY/virulence factor BrkB family protein [Bacteroidota bacterium]